ncbi:stage III sporulation protein AF, partial [Paenibacillus sepulcri]|nr:stage III sporulation protein AF [Paenibacillus sepulcri]
MLTWLASWLQQIIAVVLLAGFIDLLLPNQTMQRYVRLVAGLIILLTILTPILNLLQGDFSTRLDQNMQNWFKSEPAKGELRMPTLQDIERDADALRIKQQASVATLTEKQLAEAMRAQITRSTGITPSEVMVKLEAGTGKSNQDARVVSVVVTLPDQTRSTSEIPDSSTAVEKTGEINVGGPDDSIEQKPDNPAETGKGMRPVDEIPSVDVIVQLESDKADSQAAPGQPGEAG